MTEEKRKTVEDAIAKMGEKKETEADKGALLQGIGEDLKGDAEDSPAWAIKASGDMGTYGDAKKSHCVTAVRSLIWPGAVTVAQGTRFANIYVGYGLKSGTLVPPNPTGEPLAGTSPFFPP